MTTPESHPAVPAITDIAPGSAAAWLVALRPPSLMLAVSPVMVGLAMAFLRTGTMDVIAATLAWCAAVLMQCITNLQNDVGYTERGADAAGNRVGLPRATSSGLLTVAQVRRAIVLLCGVSVALGLVLVAYRGWPVLLIGVSSLLAALAYMGGPKPIAYTAWGEFTVFVFFGPVAVVGTDWLVSGSTSLTAIVCAVSVGALAAAALMVNNHRDREHDASVGRRTLVIQFGEKASHNLLGGLVLLAVALPWVLGWQLHLPWLWLPCVLGTSALRLARDFKACPGGLAYNALLMRVFQLELWFAALLAFGALLSANPQAGV